MIRHTFCHLPGVGQHTEQAIWQAGIQDWAQAARSALRLPRAGLLAPLAQRSLEALEAGDWRWFAKLLSGPESWRWFAELRGRCVYLDIETTGLSPGWDAVTVIACYDGDQVTCFVRDRDLGDFPTYVAGYDLLVTFNGASFDVPFLRATFPHLRLPPAHLDLLYPLRRLELRGGLKAVERQTGLARDDGLQGVDGYAAVWLWQLHQRGESGALPTLLRYAAEDVLALEPLAELVYNRFIAPLPLDLPALEQGARRDVDWPFHPELLSQMGIVK